MLVGTLLWAYYQLSGDVLLADLKPRRSYARTREVIFAYVFLYQPCFIARR